MVGGFHQNIDFCFRFIAYIRVFRLVDALRLSELFSYLKSLTLYSNYKNQFV